MEARIFTILYVMVALLTLGAVAKASDIPATPATVCGPQIMPTDPDKPNTGKTAYLNINTSFAEGSPVPMFVAEFTKLQINVCNNPFIYTYSVETPEATIQSDDVIGKFTGLLGLSSATTTDTAAAKPATAADPATKMLKAEMEINHGVFDVAQYTAMLQAANIPISGKAACNVAALRAASLSLTSAKTALVTANNQITAESSALKTSADAFDRKLFVDDVKEYEGFRAAFKEKFNSDLRNRAHSGEDLRKSVNDLENLALTASAHLNSLEFEGKIVMATRQAADLVQARDSALDTLETGLSEAEQTAKCSIPATGKNPSRDDKAKAADLKLAKDSLVELIPTAKAAKDAPPLNDSIFHRAAGRLVYQACVYLYRKHNEYQSILDKVITPLDKVLSNADNFGTSKREGPFLEPTEVKVIVHRQTADQKDLDLPSTFGDSAFTCEANPDTLFQSKDALVGLVELVKAAGNKLPEKMTGGGTAPDKPAGSSTTAKDAETPAVPPAKPADLSADTKNIVLTQPVSYGGPRLTLSGGIATTFLRNVEFQRTAGIDKTGASNNTVDYKTNSAVRVTPMIFGNTRIWGPHYHNWQSEALYATFGVTAHANDKGVTPEFFIGPSLSLAKSQFYLSAGAYIGRQQELSGGFKLHDVIPTTFTGDLPVTNSYKVGFAFGVSYRFGVSKGSDASPKAPAAADAKKK